MNGKKKQGRPLLEGKLKKGSEVPAAMSVGLARKMMQQQRFSVRPRLVVVCHKLVTNSAAKAIAAMATGAAKSH